MSYQYLLLKYYLLLVSEENKAVFLFLNFLEIISNYSINSLQAPHKLQNLPLAKDSIKFFENQILKK